MPLKGQSAVYDPSQPTGFKWEYTLGIGNRESIVFVPTQGQTEFILPVIPLTISGVFINGLYCNEHVVVGNKVIFTETDYELSPTDTFRVNYYIL